MEVSAKLRRVRISPQKARVVANRLRGMSVERAVDVLALAKPKATHILKKVLETAVANAEHNEGADVDELHIASVAIDQGPTLRRFRARARGRANKIAKRTSHITVTVTDKRR